MTDSALKDLQRIPGVGPSMAADLLGLGIHSVAALRGQDPERLYQRLCQQADRPVDRCAVYFAENTVHDPERLKWWHWKDRP